MGLTRVRFDWANLQTTSELCGPREFAKALLQEFHAAQQSDFGNWLSFSCSDESVRGVIELAYYASLLEEEGRPTRFRILFGADDADALPLPLLARFDTPLAISDVADIMKIAPALTSQEVALWMTERKGKKGESWLECLGLLNAGVDPNAVYAHALTALMWAAGYGHSDTVKALLEAGARAELKDDRGKSALDIARDGNFPATVKLLEAAAKG